MRDVLRIVTRIRYSKGVDTSQMLKSACLLCLFIPAKMQRVGLWELCSMVVPRIASPHPATTGGLGRVNGQQPGFLLPKDKDCRS